MSHEAKLVNINTCKHQLKTFNLSLAFQIRENYLRGFFFLECFPLYRQHDRDPLPV